MFTVKAPAVVKLLGEHAVLYGRPSVAAALDMQASASVASAGGDRFIITLRAFGNARQELDTGKLKAIADSYAHREDIKDYMVRSRGADSRALPYLTIAARLVADYGLEPRGMHVSIDSEVPLQKGYASSAACSIAFTIALLREAGLDLPDKDVIELARDGERVVHMNENAGGIDASTSYYGGYVSYSTGAGACGAGAGDGMELLLVDTGPKASTAEMIGRVAALRVSRPDYAEGLLSAIGDCASSGLSALKAGDLRALGAYMFKTHEALAALGVSSDGLDLFVDTARRGGLYGAKLSGGGGGGLAIAIGQGGERMLSVAHDGGFTASISRVSASGAKDFYSGKGE